MSEPSPISAADVVHVAKLARLELTAGEVEMFTEQLASILGHAADVAALDLEGLEPTAHPLELLNVVRPDVVQTSLDRPVVLAAAPKVLDDRFAVPRIVGEEP